jgi:UPF0755 protein
MMYASRPHKRSWPKRLVLVALLAVILVVAATVAVRYVYNQQLLPVGSSEEVTLVTIENGATVEEIAQTLQEKGLIKSAWAFRMYVSSKEARSDLKAGEYELQPSLGVAEIVSVISGGKIATNLVTIIPGKRIDQIKQRFAEEGFSAAEIDTALNPASYSGNPALVDKPAGASLEGYIYPDSYQKTSTTTAQAIVLQALVEMEEALTPELRSAFAAQGLSVYQAIILASVVEREVSSQSDRNQAAQVFLKRLQTGMALQSDATTFYFDSYAQAGLPPTPISNVTKSSLQAVAHPATTDWLYFVSGDDGVTRFSGTLAEHQSNIDQFCQQTCTRR